MNLVQTIGVCGNVLAGAAQMLPIEAHSNITSKKIQNYVGAYAGLTIGVLAHQSILLTGNSTLLANKWVITVVASGLGALATKYAYKDLMANKKSEWMDAIMVCTNLANGVLGLASLYQRQYAFGLSALACTAKVFFG